MYWGGGEHKLNTTVLTSFHFLMNQEKLSLSSRLLNDLVLLTQRGYIMGPWQLAISRSAFECVLKITYPSSLNLAVGLLRFHTVNKKAPDSVWNWIKSLLFLFSPHQSLIDRFHTGLNEPNDVRVQNDTVTVNTDKHNMRHFGFLLSITTGETGFFRGTCAPLIKKLRSRYDLVMCK